MIINNDVKYTLDDLRILPQYSEIESRSNVDVGSSFYSIDESCRFDLKLPIISSPMDTVTESEMLARISLLGGLGIIHRFRDIKWTQSEINKAAQIFMSENDSEEPLFGAAIGVNRDYLERLSMIIDEPYVHVICVDIAHGHHLLMKKAVEKILERLSGNHLFHLMAGNVATFEGVKYLFDMGVNSVRVNIGSGAACFIPGTLVNTENGLKEIENIHIGDKVYTHTGELCSVVDTLTFHKQEKLIVINDTVSTKNHEYYVIFEKDRNLIDENNIHNYAFWIRADQLDKNIHLLIEIEK